ncbi:MAG: hypothetical protein ACRDGV_01375 [Candidatus Limnocylindria bacterium]
MSCRRICRELLDLVRFGHLDPRSAPHLNHLAECRSCRDEIGFDRALVQQLRLALVERVEGASPSVGSWEVILERAQAPDAGLLRWLSGHASTLASRLRAATAVAATTLALVIAAGTQVSITHPQASSNETEIRGSAGERFERQPMLPRPVSQFIDLMPDATPVAYLPPSAPRDPEAAFIVSAASLVPASLAVSTDALEPVEETTTFVIFDRSMTGPTPADHGSAVTSVEPASKATQTQLLGMPAGDPS